MLDKIVLWFLGTRRVRLTLARMMPKRQSKFYSASYFNQKYFDGHADGFNKARAEFLSALKDLKH